MSAFEIGPVREILGRDLESFVAAFERRLPELSQGGRAPDAGEELFRNAHSLKGLAATLRATALAQWGEDLERWLRVGGRWAETAPTRAHQLYQAVQERIPVWRKLNELTLQERLDEAVLLHAELRRGLKADFPDSPDEVMRPATEWPTLRAPSLIRRADPPAQPTRPASPVAGRPPAPTMPLKQPAQQPAPPATGRLPGVAIQMPTVPVPQLRGRTVLPARETPPAQVAPPIPFSPREAGKIPGPGIQMPSVAAPQLLGRSDVAKTARPATPVPPPRPPGPVQPGLPTVALPPLKAAVAGKRRPTQPQPAEPTVPPPDPAGTPGTSGLPPAAAAPVVAEDLIAILRDEVAVYLGELSQGFATLAGDVGSKDAWVQVRRLFHTIKGTAATCGLNDVAVPAKLAEARSLVAVEDPQQRTRESIDVCLGKADEVAQTLCLPFATADLRERLHSAVTVAPPAAPPADPAPDPVLLEFFIVDAGEQIEALEQAVLAWERGDDVETKISTARRNYHTIKGAANSIGLRRLGAAVHEAESLLEGFGAGGRETPPAFFQWLLGSVDQVRGYLRGLAADATSPWVPDWKSELQQFQPTLVSEPAPAPESGTAASSSRRESVTVFSGDATELPGSEEDTQSIRIDSARLYQLINLAGELVADRSRLEHKMEQLSTLLTAARERNRALGDHVGQFQREFEFNLLRDRATAAGSGTGTTGSETRKEGFGAAEFSELEFDRYDQFSILTRQLMEIASDQTELYEELSAAAHSFTRDNTTFRETSQQLHKRVINLSMVPLSGLQPRLLRAFRDAVAVEHKEAALHFEGENVTVDKSVSDRLYPPLLHLLRNAVSHGVEDSATRTTAGKSAGGVVTLTARQAANQVVITITDDGPGIRLAAIHQRAVAKGWAAADAPLPSLEQATQWIFQPGFSTAERVTEVSGRGIGLDIVRQEIQGLNGTVELHSREGGGTTWTIRVPVTLAVTEAIFAVVGDQSYALPLNYVEAGLVLEPEHFTRRTDGREAYLVGDVAVPLIRLSELLGGAAGGEVRQGVLVSAGDARVIFGVDRVLGRQEIVVKQLDELLAQHPLLSGATLDVSGRALVVLNVPNLVRYASGSEWRSATPAPAVPEAGRNSPKATRVLIVDDSLSVRKVQDRLLRGLGCEVVAAADGLEALEKMRTGEFDLICTDLEMPRLNGYELIAELHTHPVWGRTPIVVVSSRSADKYITKAMNLGARTFLAKPFTEPQLAQVLRHYTRWSG